MRGRRRAQAQGNAVAAACCFAWGGWGLAAQVALPWYPVGAAALGVGNLAVAWWLWRGA